MAVRVTVQADDRDECIVGFELLLKVLAGAPVEVRPTLAPTPVSLANSCMARFHLSLPRQLGD